MAESSQSYSAGNLEVEIMGVSQNAVDSISNVIKNLNKLKNSINAISKADIGKFGANLRDTFDGLSDVMSTIATEDISNFSNLTKATNQFKNFANAIQKVDSRKVYGNLNSLFRGIASSVNAIDEATLAKITKLSDSMAVLKNVSPSVRNINRISSTASASGIGVRTVFKLGGTIAVARRYARIVGQILQYGVDYTETLNLWQVAMRDNVGVATDYVKKMREAYGISEQTLMNAQAIFKNMLSSMGNLGDEAAYRLSESVTKMAIDYASLYNVEISAAITKFQAALAGQVRPIRTTSGYDITENTLYQLYQTMGGTKTMRQLTITEKRLLAIYAIFQQMGATGALGDMEKTLGNFANQARMATENWKQLQTWVGITLQYLLQESNVMVYLNAMLSLAADIAKSFAYSMGYVDPDFGIEFADGMNDASEATDKLKGKLLGFDKFRALNQQEDNIGDTLGIDETILKAMESYRSQIDSSNNAAEQLKKTWADILGLVDENGDGIYDNTEKLEKLLDTLKLVGVALGVIVGFSAIAVFGKAITFIFTLKNALMLLNVVLVAGIIVAIYKAIQAFKDGNVAAGILATTIAVVLVGAFALLNRKAIASAISSIGTFIGKLIGMNATAIQSGMAIGSLTVGFLALAAAAVGAFFLIKNWGDMSAWQRIIGVIGVATTAILGLAMAMGAFHSAWSMGLAVAGIVAGIAMMTAAIASAKKEAATPVKYAQGGLPDKGTLFVAGEAGAEMVYNNPNGQSGVANVQQIQQAMYNALVAYGETHKGDNTIEVYLDGEVVYRNTTSKAKAHGNVWAKA